MRKIIFSKIVRFSYWVVEVVVISLRVGKNHCNLLVLLTILCCKNNNNLSYMYLCLIIQVYDFFDCFNCKN
jgi:hypothetical protein